MKKRHYKKMTKLTDDNVKNIISWCKAFLNREIGARDLRGMIKVNLFESDVITKAP